MASIALDARILEFAEIVLGSDMGKGHGFSSVKDGWLPTFRGDSTPCPLPKSRPAPRIGVEFNAWALRARADASRSQLIIRRPLFSSSRRAYDSSPNRAF